MKEALGGYIDYVREVGGKYVLNFMRNGIRETKSSETDTAKTYIERKKSEKYTDEEMQNISDKLNSIHTLETREDENEETILTSIVDKMLVDVNSDYSDINKIIEDNFWDLI